MIIKLIELPINLPWIDLDDIVSLQLYAHTNAYASFYVHYTSHLVSEYETLLNQILSINTFYGHEKFTVYLKDDCQSLKTLLQRLASSLQVGFWCVGDS